jgi:photosystem II stability/assembly factor-like uncharacterized protein
MLLGDGLEPLPQELDGIQRDLFADGANWQQRVPPATRLNQQLRAALQANPANPQHQRDTSMDDPQASFIKTLQTQRTDAQPRGPDGGRRPRYRRSRLGALFAITAAVVVVALLVGVLAMLRGQSSTAKGTGTPTVSDTPGSTPSPSTSGPVVVLPLRTTIQNQPGIPVAAPSDANTLYEYADNGQGPVLRRSDDGGATWRDLAHDFTVPTPPNTFVGGLTLAVNPADAENVFLELALEYQPGDPNACHAPSMGQKGTFCPTQYVSVDGGDHWTQTRLPVAGTLFPNGSVAFYDATRLQAQGSRLYAAMQNGGTDTQPTMDIRIISTTNRGKTWQVADKPLMSQGLHICDYTATPVGATLFARTSAQCQNLDSKDLQLWRSDDAGAHWAKVGTFQPPLNQAWVTLKAVNPGGDPTDVVLYAIVGVPNEGPITGIYASTDGGTTWVQAPMKGLPAGAEPVQISATALYDGSLVVVFQMANAAPATPGSGQATPTPGFPSAQQITVSCYTWKAGTSSWLHLTGPTTEEPGLSVVNLYVTDGPKRVVTLTVANTIETSSPTYTIQRFE